MNQQTVKETLGVEALVIGTGHRPCKLTSLGKGVYRQRDGLTKLDAALERLCEEALRLEMAKGNSIGVVSGMALGYDMALAQAAMNLGLPLLAAVPCASHGGKEWDHLPKQQARHKRIGEAAKIKHIVCAGEYAGWMINKRNEYMIGIGDVCLALWDGTTGGTGNCIRSISTAGKTYSNLWSTWQRTGFGT